MKNPGVHWHETRRREADQQDRMAKKPALKEFFHGKSVAHLESSLAARAMGLNPPGNYLVKILPNHEYGGYTVEIWDKRTKQPIAWSRTRTKKEAHAEAVRLLKEHSNPRRPHGKFRSCVRKVSRQRPRVRDPKAVCGAALSEYRSLYRTALTHVSDPVRAKKLVERWYQGKLQGETIRAQRRAQRNPIAIYGLGNPRMNGRINAKIEGVIYNRVVEIKAEKTGYRPGFYRHPFSRKSAVQILALDNGDLLVHSTAGVRLWKLD